MINSEFLVHSVLFFLIFLIVYCCCMVLSFGLKAARQSKKQKVNIDETDDNGQNQKSSKNNHLWNILFPKMAYGAVVIAVCTALIAAELFSNFLQNKLF
jgi:hypothetical protein